MFFRKCTIFLTMILVFFLWSGKSSARTANTGDNTLNISISEVHDTSINLKWTLLPNIRKYEIYRASTDGTHYVHIASVSSTEYTNTGLTPSTTYRYFIRAYSFTGEIINSSTVKAATIITRQVLGFTADNSSTDKSSYNSLVKNSAAISEIATYTYSTDKSGNISGSVPSDQIGFANNNNIKALALVTNNFDSSTASSLLEDGTSRQNLISNIESVLRANSYKGVNIDFENIKPSDRSYFTNFMSELYKVLHPQGYTVTVDVAAKTKENLSDGWSGAYDYKEIGKYADQVILMTYDEHYSNGTPGPIASYGWVESVINYALSTIPPEKVLLGTAAYGYDWSSRGTRAYGIDGVYILASKYNVPVQWDSISKTPYIKYTDSGGVLHQVWFENETSLGYKLDLVNSYGLSGIAIWRLGLENHAYWTTIRNKLY